MHHLGDAGLSRGHGSRRLHGASGAATVVAGKAIGDQLVVGSDAASHELTRAEAATVSAANSLTIAAAG